MVAAEETSTSMIDVAPEPESVHEGITDLEIPVGGSVMDEEIHDFRLIVPVASIATRLWCTRCAQSLIKSEKQIHDDDPDSYTTPPYLGCYAPSSGVLMTVDRCTLCIESHSVCEQVGCPRIIAIAATRLMW